MFYFLLTTTVIALLAITWLSVKAVLKFEAQLAESRSELAEATHELMELKVNSESLQQNLEYVTNHNNELQSNLERELENNATILSQRKSSETRLGQITEHLIPFLTNFKYDPKTAHFLGNYCDYIIFDLYSSDPAIVFLECKTGNSKLSDKQKLIKNLIYKGKVRWEEFRIDEKGIKIKKLRNEED